MTRTKPPYRADHVGSLLRPPEVHDARRRRAEGTITAEELRAVEDAAIADAVATLEGLGMRSITDGEFRRAWFHLDFLQQLDNVAVTGNIAASSDAAETVHLTPPKLSVVGRLAHSRDIQVADYRYLASVTTQTPKVSIPSPTMVHFRGGRAAIDIEASGTRKEELLFDSKELTQVWKLRRVLLALEPGAALELLIDRLKTTKTNNEFLTEVAKSSG